MKDGQTKFKCTICDTSFANVDSVTRHMDTIHLKTRLPECDICKKVLSTASALKRHIARKHKGIRRYKCDFCDKFLEGQMSLALHIVENHSNQASNKKVESQKNQEKSVKKIPPNGTHSKSCDVCDESFSCNSRLLFHMSKAHGQKHLFKCDDCEKVYKTSENFNKHLKKFHPNQPKVQTPSIFWSRRNGAKCCQTQFTVKEKFLYHQVKNHGQPGGACDDCEKAYTNERGLYFHKLRYHN